MIARPSFVAMRARNPSLRWRGLRLGCQVRFTVAPIVALSRPSIGNDRGWGNAPSSRVARSSQVGRSVGWRDRSRFLQQQGQLAIFEFDLYSQALSKIERGFETDLVDVKSMLAEGLVERATLRRLFDAIVGEMFRFPAIDAAALAEDLSLAMTQAKVRQP